MRVRVDSSALRQAKWSQYALRFLFGGLITAGAGLVASRYGPIVGGLLLAFPAIFPASATLIEKHEKEKKEKHGMAGAVRGRQAASVDAAGSAMGSLGLILFAIIIWQFVSKYRAGLVLFGATTTWLLVSICVWQIRKHGGIGRRKRRVTVRE
jgi:hypothetical protein